ncbi:MAG: hypothetical protein RJB41_1202, partial [Actinomycetota bacterium]
MQIHCSTELAISVLALLKGMFNNITAVMAEIANVIETI